MKLVSKCLSVYPRYIQRVYCSTQSNLIYPSEKDEYASNPLYPQISEEDNLPKAVKARREWYKKIKRQLTVEEKLFEINVPRYWGWKCFMIREGIIPYNNLLFAQHMTRTHIIETETLPAYYDECSKKVTSIIGDIKSDIVDAIEYQLGIRHKKLQGDIDPLDKENELTNIVINALNNVILSTLGDGEEHLKSIQVDYTPRIEASWKINSLVETVVKKEYKYGIPSREIPEEYLERPSNKFIQYIGSPILQLRHAEPLPPVIDLGEGVFLNYSVPIYNYDPHLVLGYEMERRHVTNIPGFWPGDNREFSFMSYHFSNHVKNRPSSYGALDAKESLQSQAILASFGWLMPLACYKGFSTFNDVTYPIVTQTVLTDGREFTFAVFQLNTTEMYHKNPYKNPRCNICWMTPTMSLYDVFEDGKLKGFNDQVLQNLLQFYVKAPKAPENCNLRPYLGDTIKYVADYEDDDKRDWLEYKFKEFCTNKQKVRPDYMYEVQDWERIYKIQFRLRPEDAAKRPFELRENPYHRKMSDNPGHYIPKNLRPDKDLPKYRQRKTRRTYYPE